MAEKKSKEEVAHLEMVDHLVALKETEALDKGGGVLKTVGYITAAEEALREAESPWTVLKANPRIACVMISALITGIIVGIELNMAGNMLGIQSFCRQFGYWDPSEDEYAIPAHIISIWAAVSSPFQLLGNVASGYLADFFGHRPVLYLTLLTCAAGACLESFVTDWKGWLGAKIVMCLTTGLMQAGVATYISEIAPRELRGIALSTFNMFMNMGNLFSVLISYGTEHAWPSVTNERSFRVSLYIFIALPVIIFIGFLVFIVESPSWLVLHGHHEKARKSLRWLYPRDTEQVLDLKLAEIAYTVAMEAESELETVSEALVYDGPFALFPRAFTATLCNSLSATAIVLCDLGIGLVGSIEPNVKSSSAASGLITFSVCILGCGSFSGPGAVGWTYTGESGSMHLRAKTNTLGNLGNAVIAWVFVSTVSYMIAGMSLNIGYFYAAMTALSMIIVYFFILIIPVEAMLRLMSFLSVGFQQGNSRKLFARVIMDMWLEQKCDAICEMIYVPINM
ncbi:hypothetical protein N7493_002283 [Penicillium malachiteum]|uniref:Major facilitator superfamily (MFS) profile domain-containing protein n=1 Tax=Penicillium malachiteum TaxID=1324776 RepID=A0AAD6MYL2_9EURO|nr:hypothetical protein N7493_002283 [Penicillium malachiteum]